MQQHLKYIIVGMVFGVAFLFAFPFLCQVLPSLSKIVPDAAIFKLRPPPYWYKIFVDPAYLKILGVFLAASWLVGGIICKLFFFD